jgi:putative MFS transporter
MEPAQREDARAGSSVDIVARLERLPNTSFHIKTRIVVGTATIFDAYDSYAIAAVMPVLVPLWHIPQGSIGVLISAANFGQLFGALFFGWIADRIGRLRTLAISITLFAITSLACAFAWDYKSLLVLRFIEGLGLGGEVPVAAAYIGEMAKAKGRGAFFLLYESIFTVGLLFANLLGIYLVPNWGWQSMFIVGAVPALVALYLRAKLPESARWLADRGRHSEADAIVRDIERIAIADGYKLAPPQQQVAGVASGLRGSWAEMFGAFYRKRTFSVWALWFCSYFCSWGITGWAATIYTTVFKLNVATALKYSLTTSVASIVGGFAVAFLVDWSGRRKWFVGAFGGATVALATLWWIGPYSPEFVMSMLTIAFLFISSNSSMLFLYTAEIFPTRLRARGTSSGTAFNRLASSIGPPVVGILLGAYGLASVYFLLACVAFVGAVVAWIFVVETRGRVMEEISP